MLKIPYKILNFLRRTHQRLGRFASVGVKALIINANQEVLLVEHTYLSGWHLPGGGVSPGETPLAAIIREVEEEAGLITKNKPLLFAIYTHEILGAADYPILYIIDTFEKIPNRRNSPEIKQAQWFHYQQLPKETTDETRQRIKEYFEGLPPSSEW